MLVAVLLHVDELYPDAETLKSSKFQIGHQHLKIVIDIRNQHRCSPRIFY